MSIKSNTQKRRTTAAAESTPERKLDANEVQDAVTRFRTITGTPAEDDTAPAPDGLRSRASSSNINGDLTTVIDRKGLFGALPVPARIVSVKLLDRFFLLPAGCIIVHAGTGAGKSITALSMVNSLRPDPRDPEGSFEAYYVSTFEPGSPLIARSVASRSMKSFSDLSLALFYDEGSFLEASKSSGRTGADAQGDLFVYLKGRANTSRRLILCFDSLTRAVQGYRLEDRANQPTFTGGGQPMDVVFFSVLNQYCLMNNVTLFAIVNESQLPFSQRFEGATEGVAMIPDVGTLKMRVRRGGRFDQTFKATQEQLDAAGAALGYPARTAGAARSSSSIFSV